MTTTLTDDDLNQLIVMKHHAVQCGQEDDARIPLALKELREARAEIARLRRIGRARGGKREKDGA